jgi:hypothetical protein
MRLCESLMDSVKSSNQQRVLMEKDHRYSLIIGGINIFLPSSEAGASINVVSATIEGQPT